MKIGDISVVLKKLISIPFPSIFSIEDPETLSNLGLAHIIPDYLQSVMKLDSKLIILLFPAIKATEKFLKVQDLTERIPL